MKHIRLHEIRESYERGELTLGEFNRLKKIAMERAFKAYEESHENNKQPSGNATAKNRRA